MKYLHTMVRITDIGESLHFYCGLLGLREQKRHDCSDQGYILIFVGADETPDAAIELTYNLDPEDYTGGRNFGHLAFGVDNIYETCQRLRDGGVAINRPPRDGRMAFVRSPDGISVELLQKGEPLPPAEPWTSMENTGSW